MAPPWLSDSPDFLDDRFSFSGQTGRTIISGRPVALRVTFCQNYAGRCQDRIELLFEDKQLQTRFLITRPLLGVVGDKADYELLKPTAPYVPRNKSKRQSETKVVEGVMPPSLNAIPYVGKLPHAPIPPQLISTLSTGSAAHILSRVKTVFLPPTFDSQSYARHFKYLLWIEEHRAEHVFFIPTFHEED